MLVVISAPIFRFRHRLDPAQLQFFPHDPRRQNGPMLGRNSREKASQMWWQKLEKSFTTCEHSAMASLAGGIFHLRKMDPERRDLFFNEVST